MFGDTNKGDENFMIHRIMLVLCGLISVPTAAAAQHYNIQNIARLDILRGYPTQNGHMLAAHIQLRDKWKTYWRAPGGNGIPPLFDWTGSKNVRAVSFHWPEPTVFYEAAGQTIGYKSELVLPISVIPQVAGQPISLKGEVAFGVCQDICIPLRAKFALNIAGTDPHSQRVIHAALKKQPKTAKAAGIHSVSCFIKPIKDGFNLTASMKTRSILPTNTFTVVEFPHPDVWIEQDRTTSDGTKLTASANLYSYGDTPLIVDRRKITMTLLGGKHAIEVRGCPS